MMSSQRESLFLTSCTSPEYPKTRSATGPRFSNTTLPRSSVESTGDMNEKAREASNLSEPATDVVSSEAPQLGTAFRSLANTKSLLGYIAQRRASRDDVRVTKLRMQSFRNGTSSFGDIPEVLTPNSIPEAECKCPKYSALYDAFQRLQIEVEELRIRNLALEHKVSTLQKRSPFGSSSVGGTTTTMDGESASGASMGSFSKLSHISSLKPSSSVIQRSALNRYPTIQRWRGSMASTSTSATGSSSRRHSSLDEAKALGGAAKYGKPFSANKSKTAETVSNPIRRVGSVGAVKETKTLQTIRRVGSHGAVGSASFQPGIRSSPLKQLMEHDEDVKVSPLRVGDRMRQGQSKATGPSATPMEASEKEPFFKPEPLGGKTMTAVHGAKHCSIPTETPSSDGPPPAAEVTSKEKGSSLRAQSGKHKIDEPVTEGLNGAEGAIATFDQTRLNSPQNIKQQSGMKNKGKHDPPSQEKHTPSHSVANLTKPLPENMAGSKPSTPKSPIRRKSYTEMMSSLSRSFSKPSIESDDSRDEQSSCTSSSIGASSQSGNSRAGEIGKQVLGRRLELAQERRIEDASSTNRTRSRRLSDRTASNSSMSSTDGPRSFHAESRHLAPQVSDVEAARAEGPSCVCEPDGYRRGSVAMEEDECSIETDDRYGMNDPEIPGAIRLPRGGVYVKTKMGPVQFGIPPETIKDPMELGLEVPSCYVVPKIRFNIKMGINVCEVEFPAYYNFFLAQKAVNLVCTPDVQEIVKNVLDETLEGPKPDQLHVDSEYSTKLRVARTPKHRDSHGDYDSDDTSRLVNSRTSDSAFKSTNYLSNVQASRAKRDAQSANIRYSFDGRPDHEKEINFFKQPRNGRRIGTDTLMKFTDLKPLDGAHKLFEKLIRIVEELTESEESADSLEVSIADLGNDVFILDLGQQYIVVEDMTVLCRIPVFFTSWTPSMPVAGPGTLHGLGTLFDPPDFGITVLGSSHGFDAQGATSGFVLWIYKKGIMVDPPPNATELLQTVGIIPNMINGIILTHCHADHDAGTFQKFLKEGRVTLITTKTIFDSFVRKYSLISGFTDTFLLKLFETRLVKVGEPLHWGGGSLKFFYSLHALPCIGFEAHVGGKSFVYSSDTYYDPAGLDQLCRQGFISPARKEALLAFPWHYDLVLHEAGIPPIHTPTSTLRALPEDVKKNLYIIHINEADAKRSGLRLARAGVENTIVIPVESHPHQPSALLLQVLHSTELSRAFSIMQASDLLLLCDVERFEPGEFVCHQGDRAEKFYIIVSGFCSVMNTLPEGPAGKDHLFGLNKTFGPGDYLGELSLLLGHTRSASIRALTEVHLVTLDSFGFRYLLDTTPGLEDRMQRLSRIRCSLSWQAIELNSVFRRLGSMQRSNLQAIMRSEQVKQGQVLWQSDRPATQAYLVASGSLSFSEMDEELDPFFAGAFLCDLASMYNHRASLEGEVPEGPVNSSVTLVAQEQTLVYTIDAEDIIEYLDQNPGIFINLVHSVVVE